MHIPTRSSSCAIHEFHQSASHLGLSLVFEVAASAARVASPAAQVAASAAQVAASAAQVLFLSQLRGSIRQQRAHA